jgi:hypothetical protein
VTAARRPRRSRPWLRGGRPPLPASSSSSAWIVVAGMQGLPRRSRQPGRPVRSRGRVSELACSSQRAPGRRRRRVSRDNGAWSRFARYSRPRRHRPLRSGRFGGVPWSRSARSRRRGVLGRLPLDAVVGRSERALASRVRCRSRTRARRRRCLAVRRRRLRLRRAGAGCCHAARPTRAVPTSEL